METTDSVLDTTTIDLARECLYRFLAAVLADPHTDEWSHVLDPANQAVAQRAADLLRDESAPQLGPLGFGELSADELDLQPLLAELAQPVDGMREEYNRTFGLVLPKECPPYETEYYPNSDTFFRSQQLADVAGFYRAFGIEPSHASPERPDHIAMELEFMAFVLLKKRLVQTATETDPIAVEHVSVCDDAERSFFCDHLAWWVPAFATGLGRKAGRGVYAVLARVLAALIPIERQRFGVPAPERPVKPDLIERPEEQSGCAACPMR